MAARADSPPPADSKLSVQDQISAELKSGDPARIAAAIPKIRAFMAGKHDLTAFAEGVNLLLRAKQYDEVDSLVQKNLVSLTTKFPTQSDDIAKLLKYRAMALLNSGKNDQALSAARLYYDYAPLSATVDSINTVSLTLAAAKPDDKGIVRRFKKQQLAGASTQPSSAADDLGAPILAGITVDGKVFQAAADAVGLDDYISYVRKGNLLLLADNGKDAHAVFEQAKQLAEESDLKHAIENVARAIRAEDGCVGPANAYILKIRINKRACSARGSD